jgi:hypothetical protein
MLGRYPRVFSESHGLPSTLAASSFFSSCMRSDATLGAHRFKDEVVCSQPEVQRYEPVRDMSNMETAGKDERGTAFPRPLHRVSMNVSHPPSVLSLSNQILHGTAHLEGADGTQTQRAHGVRERERGRQRREGEDQEDGHGPANHFQSFMSVSFPLSISSAFLKRWSNLPNRIWGDPIITVGGSTTHIT